MDDEEDEAEEHSPRRDQVPEVTRGNEETQDEHPAAGKQRSVLLSVKVGPNSHQHTRRPYAEQTAGRGVLGEHAGSEQEDGEYSEARVCELTKRRDGIRFGVSGGDEKREYCKS